MNRALKIVPLLALMAYAFLVFGEGVRLLPAPGEHIADSYLHEQDMAPPPETVTVVAAA